MYRVFLSNLNYEATEDDISAHFAEKGFSASEVRHMRDRESGQSRGFGFLNLPADQGPSALTVMDGTILKGRALVVRQATEKPERAMPEAYHHEGGSKDRGRRERGGARR